MVVIRIANMQRKPSGFVVEVEWVAYKYDHDTQGEIRGVEKFPQETDTFVPFEQLTEAQVVTWLEGKLDLVDLEAQLDKQIQSKLANTEPYPDLPWSRIRVE